MTDPELKKLKDDLWHSADMLRAGAHLAANKYGQPILGLNADLPESYDKPVFDAKMNLLLSHFVGMAVQGYGWICAA